MNNEEELKERLREWDYSGGEGYFESNSITLINFLANKLFHDYEPCQFERFDARFLRWLQNIEDPHEQKLMVGLLLDVFFMGRREFESLCRSIYQGPISRWMIDVGNLDIRAGDLGAQIHAATNNSWICPITDSFRVNSFLKVNSLISKPFRPDWLSLRKFGDTDKICGYVEKLKISQLVLLEDFVGSGTQASKVVKFAATSMKNVDILIAPLLICPKGDELLLEISNEYENVRYEPGLIVPQESIISETAIDGESELHAHARTFFENIKSRLLFEDLKDMFGFKQTGAQVIMYSNCPNNTLPIFHHETDHWAPLFPRIRRQ